MAATASLHRLFRRMGRAVIFRAIGGVAAVCVAGAVPWYVCAAQILTDPNAPSTTDAKAALDKQPLDLGLRSVAVMEWTGPAGKPVSSVLIPVAIFTDDRFMDGDDYLADPVPLPIQGGTRYVLQRSGVPQGNYDLDAAGKLRGHWFGSGTWEPLSAPNPYARLASKPAGNLGGPDGTHSNSQDDIGPDGEKLPTLHLRPPKNAPKPPPPDPNLPVMSYGAAPPHMAANFLVGKVPHRQQMVAVSDSSTHSVRDWSFPWANAAAKNAMQQQVELLAQRLLQRSLVDKAKAAADAAAAKAAAAEEDQHSTPTLVTRPKPKPIPEPATQPPVVPALPTLRDVDFRCFAFTQAKTSSPQTPTCILTAASDPASGPTDYVAVVAQPDIYGVPQAISQSLTDASKLDANPRVQLVDVLDAAGDNKGDILLEIDGAADRQFGIYEMQDRKPKLVYITAKLPF